MTQLLDYSPPAQTRLQRLMARYQKRARLAEWVLFSAALVPAAALLSFVLLVLLKMPYYAVLLAIILLIVPLEMLRSARGRWAGRVLLHVEAAVRMQIPLSPYLRSAAESERRPVRQRLLSVSEVLDRGAALSHALTSGAPELDGRSLRLIALGESSHHLPQMLARIARHRTLASPAGRHNAMLRWYLPLMLGVTLLVLTMIVVFVTPRFETIMKDFGTSVPRAMAMLLHSARWWANDYGWAYTFPLLVLVFSWIGWDVMHIIHPRSHGLSGRRRDTLIDLLPLLGRVRQDQAAADLCWGLAAGCRDQMPLSLMAQEMLTLPLSMRVAQQVTAWHRMMQSGHAPAEAAAQAGLPPLLVSVLRVGGEKLPEALDVLGDFYDAKAHRLLVLLRSATVPVVTVLLALVVLWVELSIFMPLQALIEQVMALGWSTMR